MAIAIRIYRGYIRNTYIYIYIFIYGGGGRGGFVPPPPIIPLHQSPSFYFENNYKYSYILVEDIFWGVYEKLSWILESLVVVRATFSVGKTIWV